MEKVTQNDTKKDYNSGRLYVYSSPVLFNSTESQGLNIEKNMNRCLSIVQNTGTKWRQELAKMRGLPDPTVKNDGANNSQKSIANQQEKDSKLSKLQQENKKQIEAI